MRVYLLRYFDQRCFDDWSIIVIGVFSDLALALSAAYKERGDRDIQVCKPGELPVFGRWFDIMLITVDGYDFNAPNKIQFEDY